MEHWLVWVSLFQGKVYPKSYERVFSPAWGLAIRSWKALGERDTDLKVAIAQKERQEACQYFSFHRPTQLLQRACLPTFWLFSCMGWLALEAIASPILLGFLFGMFLIGQNKTLDLVYKNHCHSHAGAENGMTCPCRKLKPERSCKETFLLTPASFKTFSPIYSK